MYVSDGRAKAVVSLRWRRHVRHILAHAAITIHRCHRIKSYNYCSISIINTVIAIRFATINMTGSTGIYPMLG